MADEIQNLELQTAIGFQGMNEHINININVNSNV